MAYTQDDFDAVEAAIRQVRDGTRANSQSAGEASQAFVNTPIPDLIKLRESIALELSTTTPVGEVRLRGKPRLFLMRFKRGL